MVPVESPEQIPSLLRVTVRRSLVSGRTYLIIAIAYAALSSVLTGSSSTLVFSFVIALFLPLFASLGGMGALVVFTNDRMKGVFEYLIAYGVSPRRLFVNTLLASFVLVTIVLGVSLVVGLSSFRLHGGNLGGGLLELVAVYSIPMGYATVAFSSTIGMVWTSLSSPREGMNSPIGLVPFFGVAPPVITLILVSVTRTSNTYLITGAALALVGGTVIVLLASLDRLLRRERLLSPV